MTTAPKASLIITAVDDVTKKLREINRGFDKAFPRKKFANLFKESGITQIGSQLASVSEKLIAAGGLAGAGLFAVAKSTANLGEELTNNSKILNMSTTALQVYAYAGKRVGIGNEELIGGFKKFTKNMGDLHLRAGRLYSILKTGNPALLRQLQSTKDNDQATTLLLSTINRLPNAQMKASLATAAFGRNGFRMSLLAAENMSEVHKKLEDIGAIMSPEAAANGKKFNETFKDLEETFNAIKIKIGAELLPVFSKLMLDFAEFLTANKTQIAEFAKSLGRELPGAIRTVASILKLVMNIFGSFDEKTGKFEVSWWRVKTAIGLLTLAMAGPLIAAIAKSGFAIWKFFELGTKIMGLGPKIVSGFMTALEVASGPVGWIILAVGALVTLGVVLYNKWKPFHDLIDKIWGRIKQVASYIGGKLGFSTGSDSAAGATPISRGPRAPALGASLSTAFGTSRSEVVQQSKVEVSFTNVPKGVRVQPVKSDAPMQLNVAYSGVGAGGWFS